MEFRMEELKYLHQIRVIHNINQLVERSISLYWCRWRLPFYKHAAVLNSDRLMSGSGDKPSVNSSYKQWINIHIQVLLQGPDMAFVDLKSRSYTGGGRGRKRRRGKKKRRGSGRGGGWGNYELCRLNFNVLLWYSCTA